MQRGEQVHSLLQKRIGVWGWSPDGEVLALITFAAGDEEDKEDGNGGGNTGRGMDVKVPIDNGRQRMDADVGGKPLRRLPGPETRRAPLPVGLCRALE